ncbi:MAG: hypothetical protein ACX939_04955, partial [Hyphococcus sp.]
GAIKKRFPYHCPLASISMSQNNSDKFRETLDEWMEVFDKHLADINFFPISDRPFRALLLFLEHAVVSVGFGDKKINLSKPIENMEEEWFSALYGHVAIWYTNKYGKAALQHTGSDTINSVIIFRGAPFAFEVPRYRSEVEEEGIQSWIIFEDRIQDHEEPLTWLTNGPEKERLKAVEAEQLSALILHNANALRRINFQFTFTKTDEETYRFSHASLAYLQSAARRIAACKNEEFGMAWYDCQMAMESSLKLAIQHNTKNYPHEHKIKTLLSLASPFGVTFDQARVDQWPNHKTLSNHRYGQDHTSSVAELYKAYLLALDLCDAAIASLQPQFRSGAKFLIQRPRYLRDSDNIVQSDTGF